jgi:thiol-disulfide isomerase/thioredoxin
MTFINHYSFLLLVTVSTVAAASILLRRGLSAPRILLIACVAIVLGFVLRTWGAGASSLQEVRKVEAAIGRGSPVLVEIQSPYCLACAMAKPTVDRVESENPQLQVIRLNIQEPAGAQLASRFATPFTPTFLLFDPEGDEILRKFGSIEAADIEGLLDK